MAKPGSPLLGYNTNVRHKGKLYHIQTEDSGLQHPHIITHLFADGGRIIASKKTSYAEHVGRDDLKATVKKVMQEQHKAMFIALRDGVYDEDEPASAPQPDDPATAGAPGAPPAGSKDAERARTPSSSGAQPAATPSGEQPMDVDALEQAAARWTQDAPASASQRGSARPARRSRSEAGSTPRHSAAASHPTEQDTAREPAATMHRRSSLPAGSGRYQTTQPAQEQARPNPQSESIFGSDLLSEKSLDEVILSYLAEDLDEGSE